MPKKLVLTIFVLLFECIPANSQQASSTLNQREEIKLSSLRSELISYRAVTGYGEFYVLTGPNQYTAVDLDGHTHVALDTSMVPGTITRDSSDLFVINLSPVPGRGVLATVNWNEIHPPGQTDQRLPDTRSGILRFDEHGQYKDLIELPDTGFSPAKVAQFSNSEGFLAMGYDEHARLHVSLLDARGQMKVLDILPWLNSEAKPASGPNRTSDIKQASDKQINQAAMDAGAMQIVSGDDDSIYLYSPQWGAKFICVHPTGTVSEIKIEGKSDTASEMFPLAMIVDHGNVYLDQAALPTNVPEKKNGLNHFVLNAYNAANGALLKTYSLDTPFAGTPVALGPTDLYFLNAAVVSGQLSFSLIRAYP
ncbi:hypothetical protein [Granulicella mallensis]|uniref:Phytase-like domain-containing protein n=1 Tax=Granulicella mallensis (strain ATCC BAA-1857 / DSM 23137 / MP5ACTX8) TaxID=682795 RepID=G8NNX2_GRAMM|nr:hypothetical protein [Granulicella mallensis]AEU37076.1 hypothetical protein AciX8_2766 [Granulicella mallensis MP5ACTX8]